MADIYTGVRTMHNAFEKAIQTRKKVFGTLVETNSANVQQLETTLILTKEVVDKKRPAPEEEPGREEESGVKGLRLELPSGIMAHETLDRLESPLQHKYHILAKDVLCELDDEDDRITLGRLLDEQAKGFQQISISDFAAPLKRTVIPNKNSTRSSSVDAANGQSLGMVEKISHGFFLRRGLCLANS
ncbi:hypothetical protein HDU86_007422 [Geranomyces michiganensis]|nr:hypothetical protein HDU86_007422 [Geranomyces michiganensis]